MAKSSPLLILSLSLFLALSAACKPERKTSPHEAAEALDHRSAGQSPPAKMQVYVVEGGEPLLQLVSSPAAPDDRDLSLILVKIGDEANAALTQGVDRNGYLSLLVANADINFQEDQKSADSLALGKKVTADTDLNRASDLPIQTPRANGSSGGFSTAASSVLRKRLLLDPSHLMPKKVNYDLADGMPNPVRAEMPPAVDASPVHLVQRNVVEGRINLSKSVATLVGRQKAGVALNLENARVTKISVVPESEQFIVQQLKEQINQQGLQRTLQLRPEYGMLLLQHGVIAPKVLESVPLYTLDQVGPLQDLPVSKQEALVAPYLDRARMHYALTGKKTVVLGHLPDTHAAIWKNKDYITVLDTSDWTLANNMTWLQKNAIADEGAEVLLLSRPREYIDPTQPPPVLHLELRALSEAGFVRVGNFMIKAKKDVADTLEGVQRIAGVCIVPACYPTNP